MGEKLKAGQVWTKGDESFIVLWADGYNGIRAVREPHEQEGHQEWLDRQPRFTTPPVDGAARTVLNDVRLSDLIREGWSIDAERREVSDE